MDPARKITPPRTPDGSGTDRQQHPARQRQPVSRRPTRDGRREVRWWERPAPEGSDPRLWQAVQRLQVRRMQLRVTVLELSRRTGAVGHPRRRETLSRVLNGKQPTTWPTVRMLAEILDVDLDGDEPPELEDEDDPMDRL